MKNYYEMDLAFRSIKKTLIGGLCIAIAGCSAGSNGGTATPKVSGIVISGTAAGGAPIVGVVNLMDINGTVVSSPIAADGSYSLTTTNLTAPFILDASGTVNGKTIKVHNVAATNATITLNLTPLTELITANALGADPAATAGTWKTLAPTVRNNLATNMTTQAQILRSSLANILTAAGLNPANVDLLGGVFAANHSGIDAVLDTTKINYNGSVATISNTGLLATNRPVRF